MKLRQLFENQQTVIAIGDSHARAIGAVGEFENRAENGATIRSIGDQVTARPIPPNAVVALSAGHNDVAAGRNPAQIARDVRALISAIQQTGARVVYFLFPEGTNNPNQENMAAAREAIRGAVRNAIDLQSLGRLNADGQHMGRSAYAAAAERARSNRTGAVPGPQPGDPVTPATQQFDTNGDGELDADEIGSISSAELRNLDPSDFMVSSSGWASELFGKINTIMNRPEDLVSPDASGGATGVAGNTGAGATGADVPAGAANRGRASTPNAAINGVLDFIAGPESGGDYNLRNGGSRANLTSMTIQQIFDMQRNYRTWPGATSTAVGRYQYIKGTLEEMVRIMGLNPATTRFDERTQDAIATRDLRRRCRLDDWLAGRITDGDFLNLVSRVWAGVPNTSGRSTYAGVGNNRAGISANSALAQLASIRGTTPGDTATA